MNVQPDVLDTLGGPTSSRFLRTLKRGGALNPVFISPIDPEGVGTDEGMI